MLAPHSPPLAATHSATLVHFLEPHVALVATAAVRAFDKLANRAAVATSVRMFFRLFFVTAACSFASGNLLRTTHAGCESDVPSSSKIHAHQHYHVQLLALWRPLAVCEKKLPVASPPPRYMTQNLRSVWPDQRLSQLVKQPIRFLQLANDAKTCNIEGANSLGYDCDPPMLRATSLTRNTILDGRVFRIMG